MNTSFSFHKTSQESLTGWIVGALTFVSCFALAIAAIVAGLVTMFSTITVAFGSLTACCLTAAVVLIVSGPALGLTILGSSVIGGVATSTVNWLISKFK
jgi:hypothetical protein